ncbi:Response regulator receiver domain-containing protein [Arsukibacterium tuosuense]|uniref:Response regulator receiver domain-containing protein n=1 Tax=Arsukibacterium tuosuense TaxID=1323745 RepID=A0A285IUP4_9GAMM|nr:response regulator [Arsukibacterium tuosuense]SNY51417.1 Response regulator receiver domain-containing protein [Arsukibacterium tuosuense]
MIKLLFVDDDAFVLSAYRRMLHNSGHQCVFLSFPEQVWTTSELANVDIAFIDQQMPGITGSMLLFQLQQRFPLIKRVLMSGDVDVALQQLVTEQKLDAVLAKPCSKTALIQCIDKLSIEKPGRGPPISL